MAKLYKNEKGFKIIELNDEELKHLHDEIGFGCICGKCNQIVETDYYYIAVLNDIYCKKCIKEFLSYSPYYPQDSEFENRRFESIKTILGLYYEEDEP